MCNGAGLGGATVQYWQVNWDVPLCRIGRRIGGCNGVELGGATGQNWQDGGSISAVELGGATMQNWE